MALANNIPPDRLHVLDASVADARPDGPDAWRVRAEAPVLGAVLDVAHPRANLVLAESLETNLLDPGPLANLRRAAATLLSPGYACVPAAAVVRAQVVTSAHLRDSITLRPLGDASDPADPVWFRETTRTSPAACGASGEDDLVAVSEPFEAFRVDFANLPPETVETRAIVPIVLGDEQRSAAAEALAVAYWWTCDATKSSSSAKSTASSPPARGSPTRRLAILPTPVRIPEDATTLVVSIVRDEDRVRFRRVAARAEDSAREDSEREDPEDEDPEREDPEDPSRGGGGVSVSRPRPEHVLPLLDPVGPRESRALELVDVSRRVARRCASRVVRFPVCPFHRRVRGRERRPALAILAADAGAKGVLSLETTREGAVFARRLARACGVADVVHACAVRFDRDENLARTNLRDEHPRGFEPSDEHPRGFDPSPPSFDPFAVASAASTEATRACRAARTAATRARGADDAVVAAPKRTNPP